MLKTTTQVVSIGLLSLSASAADLTRDNGAVVGDNQNSQTAGADGPVLLQDVQLIQKLLRFDRERIPERVVHARGTGAHGTFTITDSLSDVSRAGLFAAGQVTPVFVRFSSVVHSTHSAETLRDPRGFATRFYTADCNWDLVGNNFPTFFIRDAIKFPDMVHAFKPDPRTNLDDDSRRFDFFAHVPESTRTLTELYSNSGTPASYREMNGNGVHVYKLINDEGKVHYVKFPWKSLQGVKNLDPTAVEKIQGQDYSHMTRDLIAHIDKAEFPKWDLYVQVITPEQLDAFYYDPLYEPSNLQPREQVQSARYKTLQLNGFTQQLEIQHQQNFKQAGDLYLSYDKKERTDLINTFGSALANTDDVSKHAIFSFLFKTNSEHGTGVTRVAKGNILRVKALAKILVD